MALNIRKIVAQRATKFYKNKENVNFYIISIEIDVYSLIRNVYVPDSLYVLGCKILCFMKFNHSHISIIKISLQIY